MVVVFSSHAVSTGLTHHHIMTGSVLLPSIAGGKTKLRGLYCASELYRPSDRRLLAKLVQTFGDRGCRVVSVRALIRLSARN
jgi:hypothetical protein